MQALQFLECLDCKDTNQKAQFFRNTLLEVFAIIPKVGPLDRPPVRTHNTTTVYIFRNCGCRQSGLLYKQKLPSKRFKLCNPAQVLQTKHFQMMAAVLESIIFLVEESSQLEYETFIQPHTRYIVMGSII